MKILKTYNQLFEDIDIDIKNGMILRFQNTFVVLIDSDDEFYHCVKIGKLGSTMFSFKFQYKVSRVQYTKMYPIDYYDNDLLYKIFFHMKKETIDELLEYGVDIKENEQYMKYLKNKSVRDFNL